jgi:hypothetical protein
MMAKFIDWFSLSMMQVNETLTNLNLGCNWLGSVGGKALAEPLQVIFQFQCQQ